MSQEFEPEWQGIFERWTHAYMRVHYWKIQHDYDYDEAIQECAFVFSWCLRKTIKHGGRIDNAAWFMRYYQRAVYTMVMTKATKDTQHREALKEYRRAQLSQPRTEFSDASLAAALTFASDELKAVLNVIFNTPSQFMRDVLLRPGDDLDWSKRICRLCGVKETNVIAELKRLLQS